MPLLRSYLFLVVMPLVVLLAGKYVEVPGKKKNKKLQTLLQLHKWCQNAKQHQTTCTLSLCLEHSELLVQHFGQLVLSTRNPALKVLSAVLTPLNSLVQLTHPLGNIYSL